MAYPHGQKRLWRLSFSFPTSKKLRQVYYYYSKSQVYLSHVRKLSGPSGRPTCRLSKLSKGVLSTRPCFRIFADSFPRRFDKSTSKYNNNIDILLKFAMGNENETGNNYRILKQAILVLLMTPRIAKNVPDCLTTYSCHLRPFWPANPRYKWCKQSLKQCCFPNI